MDQDYGYMDGYLKKKQGISSGDYQFDKPMQLPSDIPTPEVAGKEPLVSPEFQKGASRGAGGGVGSMLLSGGVASGNPYAAGAGLGLMALEGDSQAKQAEDEARAVEAQQRKQAQLAAINNLIGVSKGLSVM